MHQASTPTPRRAPAGFEPERRTLHDGTWPLSELIAQLRGTHDLHAAPTPAATIAPPVAVVRPRHAQPGAQPRKRRRRSADSRQLIPTQAAQALRRQAEPGLHARSARLRAKAEDLVRRRRLEDALKVMHSALSLDRHDAESLAYTGWLLLQTSPASSRQCLELLDRAQRADPRSARVCYLRGLVHKTLGDGERAVECFERALDLDPDDLQAARELRLHALRVESRGDRSAGGVLSGWLRRR